MIILVNKIKLTKNMVLKAEKLISTKKIPKLKIH